MAIRNLDHPRTQATLRHAILAIMVLWAPPSVRLHSLMADDDFTTIVGHLYSGLQYGNWPWSDTQKENIK